MIKIGKLQVNKNISPKTFWILTIFSLILFFILWGYSIYNYFKQKDYIELNAVITEVGYRYIPAGGEANAQIINYIKLSYEYDDKTYSSQQRVAFKFNKKVGNLIRIYINPNNPEEMKDTYITNINFIINIITLVITIFLIKAYKIRKNKFKI